MIVFILTPLGPALALLATLLILFLGNDTQNRLSYAGADNLSNYTGESRLDAWWMPLHETYISEVTKVGDMH